jgi:hypothetical protein
MLELLMVPELAFLVDKLELMLALGWDCLRNTLELLTVLELAYLVDKMVLMLALE